MGKLKNFFIGASVAILNISVSVIKVFKPERCTGACGTCGFTCVEPLVGMVGIGFLIVFRNKVKKKFNKVKIRLLTRNTGD